VEIDTLPRVPRNVALDFVEKHISERTSPQFNAIDIFKQILDPNSKHLMKYALSNNNPLPVITTALIWPSDNENLVYNDIIKRVVHKDDVTEIMHIHQGNFNIIPHNSRIGNALFPQPKTFEDFMGLYYKWLVYDLIVSRHNDVFVEIDEYFNKLASQNSEPNVVLEECISKIYVNYDWTTDQTVVNIINDLHTCKSLDEFKSKYLNYYTTHDQTALLNLIQNKQQTSILPEISKLVENTCHRILQLLTFDKSTTDVNPICVLEVISCHLLYLILRMFIVPDENNDDTATSVICFHTIGMVLVDAVTDRITHEIQNSSQNEFMKYIIDAYKSFIRSRMNFPNTIQLIGTHQAELDRIIREFIALHEKSIDSTYASFFKTYFLDRKSRSELKVSEFLIQLASQQQNENPSQMRTVAKETHEDIVNTVETNIQRIIDKYPQGHQNNIMYDHSFLVGTLLSEKLGAHIKRYNPTLYELLSKMQ
jgi:hypothetical protein